MTWLPRKTVVVPIDFSDNSFAALAAATELVDDPAHLHVIHVLHPLEPADPGVIWHTIDDESRSQHAGDALRQELAKRGHAGLQTVIRFGDAGREIADFAEGIGAGLIVVASRGQSGWERILLGSVAERILRLAHCAVLVLKGK